MILCNHLLRLLRYLAHCVPLAFVRMNPAYNFPCALYLQNLELYYFLTGGSYYSPEIWRQANSVIEQGEIAKRVFNTVDETINNMTTIVVLSY